MLPTLFSASRRASLLLLVALVWSLQLHHSSEVLAMSPSSLKSGSSCAVVGAGVLGTSLCRQILQADSTVSVTGITKTTSRHADIREQFLANKLDDRFQLVTSEDVGKDKRFDNVVFCAPPSGFEDYPAAVKDAVDNLWAGPEQGVFVFTSSGAIYGPGDTSEVTENSPLADAEDNPRIARLLNAEKACLEAGGCCLRLAGLYNLQRGPHNFWLTSGKGVSGGANGLINMLHYDDAASACLAALQAGPSVCRGKAFLISDGNPISRRGICESALKAKVYEGKSMPEFKGSDDLLLALGKVYNGAASNRALNWKPHYESFDAFMTANS